MGVTSSNKLVNTTQISCDGTVKITLALTAAPDIISNPTDIVLVLDRSGSMAGTPLASMKAGADTFIDIIEEATDGVKDGVIGGGSHIGIVSFASSASVDEPLITSVAELKTAVATLTAGGNTNHADAFEKAISLFNPASSNHKAIVMFTDGNTTAGLPPAPVAAAARAQGIVIYCIGLIGADGIDVSALEDWATDPSATHVAVTPDAADLEELFADLAANISKTGATDIVIDEVVSPDFIITSVTTPSKGTAALLNARTLRWSIAELGVTASESATLELYARHTGLTSGTKPVNQSISYSDNEGNVVTFPSPTVTVDCGAVVHPEECPLPVDVAIDGCTDATNIDLGDTYLESMGRIAQFDVTIRNVCPNRRVALAINLTEVDQNGLEYQRGTKTMTIPAHTYPSCRDVHVKCVKFILPEDLSVSGGGTASMCSTRSFKARTFAHYIDSDYRCCDQVFTL